MAVKIVWKLASAFLEFQIGQRTFRPYGVMDTAVLVGSTVAVLIGDDDALSFGQNVPEMCQID